MRRAPAAVLLFAMTLVGRGAGSVPGPGVDIRAAGLADADEERLGAVVPVDADDDDEDGVADRLDGSVPPADVVPIVVTGRGPVTLRALSNAGRVRVLRGGRPVALPLRLAASELPATLGLQGVRASDGSRDVLLVAGRADDPTKTDALVATVVGLALLGGDDAAIPPTTGALGVSHAIAVDGTLPVGLDYAAASANRDDVRLEVFDAGAAGTTAGAILEAVDPETGVVRDGVELGLERPDPSQAFRSQFVRIVADEMDEQALEERGGLALRVGLRDEVRATYGGVRQSIRVGRPAWEDGPLATRIVRTRVVVVRDAAGALPVGTDGADATRIAREQIGIANEIWSQCGITFGDPDDVAVSIVDTPRGVDLSDGLLPFSDFNASIGTAEEQALLGAVMDRDPGTIDLVVVNRFTGGGRQGEAFIASDAARIANAVVLDAHGIANERTSWTQSHEIGHVLLGQGGHPDGDHLLMDSDAALASVYGPKRITPEECARVRAASEPTILARANPPRAWSPPETVAWETGYPRPAVAPQVRGPAWAPLTQVAIVPLGPPSGGTPSSPPMVFLPTIPLAPVPATPLFPVYLVPLPPS